MATPLTKPVARRVHDARWGDVTVTLTAAGVTVRERGKRHAYGPVPYGVIALAGAKMEAEETVRERYARRSGRSGMRAGLRGGLR